MTYNVFGGTLNPTQSINHDVTCSYDFHSHVCAVHCTHSSFSCKNVVYWMVCCQNKGSVTKVEIGLNDKN